MKKQQTTTNQQLAEAADMLRRAEAEISRLQRLLAEARAEIDAFLAIREAANGALAERDDLRRQLAQSQSRTAEYHAVADAYSGVLAVCREVLGAADNAELVEIAESLEQERADLRRQLAEANAALTAWQTTGDAIMLAVCGRVAPLSDSDVIGVVADLRWQLEEWQLAE